MKKLICAVVIGAGALPSWAQSIYKCTDASGATVITNSNSSKNCKLVSSGPDNTVAAPKAASSPSAAPVRPSSASNPTHGSFPRVNETTQRSRDGDRRRILEQELANEQRSVEQAKRTLAEQETVRNGDEKNYQKVIERLQTYKDAVAQHERNVQAIQKELNALR